MAIEFEQETGTGSSTSTSYASVDQFLQFWENRGTDYSSLDDEVVEAYLNSATAYIDMTYEFKGSKTNDDQALEWPRYNVVKDDRRYLYHGTYLSYYDDDEIPLDLIRATCYLAAQITNNPLNQVDNNIRSISIGPVSKSFAGNSSNVKYREADKLLKKLVLSGNQLVRVN